MSVKREGELFIPFLSLITDVLVVEFSILFAYWLRFYSPLVAWFPVTKGFPPFHTYLEASILVMIVWIFIFQHFGMYHLRRNVTPVDEFYLIIKAVSLGMLLMMSFSFFYRDFSFSRLVFLYIWIICILLLTISRTMLIFIEHRRHRKGKGVLKVALVGHSPKLHAVIENINQFPGLGLKICGYIGEKNESISQIAHLGLIAELPMIIRNRGIHTLIISPEEQAGKNLWSILKLCEGLNVEFLLLPDLLEIFTNQLHIYQIGRLPTLQIRDVRMKGWQGVLKRIFDVVFSIFILIMLSPLFLLIGLIIKFDSKGRIFYKQDRVGFDGKEFLIYKFRTMREDAEAETGPVWTTEDDPRRTRVGKFLRRTSLDELPQFFNVLKGDMSVVGPRPERKFFVDKFKTQIPRYLERHRVKSGLTGWAQINGLRGNSPIEERTQYDIYYIENWSLAFDFKIILKTIWAVIVGENSY